MPTIKVDDINMYYEVYGEGEPVVFIAGLSMDITSSELIIGSLSKKYRVLVFDNRGAGRTDKPDIPYTIEMMADDTAGLLKVLNITQAHIVGVSNGWAHRHGTGSSAPRTGKKPYLNIDRGKADDKS